MPQFIPSEKQNLARVRTGYERVVAHRVGMPFSYVAKGNGQVIDVNEKLKLLQIQYTESKDIVTIQYGETYSKNSSDSFHVTQKLVVNDLHLKSRFKEGDVLVYNTSFFSADPLSTQVDMGVGYMSTVAFQDNAGTFEDGCLISKSLVDPLAIQPVMVNTVVVDKDTTLHKAAMVGSEVRSIDPLMIFDEVDLGDEFGDDDETAAVLMTLNKSIPKAKYSGKVVKVEVFHRCEVTEMSPTMSKFVKNIISDKQSKANYGKSSTNSNTYKPAKPVVSTKIEGTRLDEDTVVFKFYIQQAFKMGAQDKIVFSSSLKSICSGVMEVAPETESGKHIDAMMSASSIQNRIVTSPIWHGSLEMIMEKIEDDVVNTYFSK